MSASSDLMKNTAIDDDLVSIGMSIYNCGGTLPLAVRSIINQSYPHWELLLIDDGSTDNTLEVARSFNDPRIKVFSDGQNKRLPTRLNEAISLAQGKYFARMDGDDIAYPQRLEKQVEYLETHPEVDLVGAQIMVFNNQGQPLGKRAAPEHHEAICARPTAGFAMAHPTYCGKLNWFQKYGYDRTMIKAQDQGLLLRSYQQSRFANVPEILLGYREDELNLRKLFLTRRFLAESLWREFNKQGRSVTALQAVTAQVIKMGVDTLAIQAGLHHHLLKHRARSASKEEHDNWNLLWKALNSQSS
jgi:glycosyltransferase involved in cell wall biosynthesis